MSIFKNSLKQFLLLLVFLLVSVTSFCQGNDYGQKNIVIFYDEDEKEATETFFTLLSNRNDLKAAKFLGEEKNKPEITSKQYVVTIGEKSSADSKFDNTYSNYGISIGYFGKKAWIRCNDKFEWNETAVSNFGKEFETYCKKFGLSADYEEYNSQINKSWYEDGSFWLGAAIGTIVAGPFAGAVAGYFSGDDEEDIISKYQYKLAILIFYDQILDNYIKNK